MTQAKAASLTSALFARKGSASPADLVIAELEDAADAKASTRKARSKERGGEAAQRKKVKLPEVEQELPLLAFVDARTSEGAAAEKGSAEGADPAGTGADTDAVDQPVQEDGHPDPAASLMAHRPLAFGGGGPATDEDGLAEASSSEAEGQGLVVPEDLVATEDDKGPDLPAPDIGSSDEVMVVADSAGEAVDAVKSEEPDAKPLVGEADGKDEDQALAAPLADPAHETPLSNTGTGDQGAVSNARPEGADPAAPEDGALPEDTRTGYVLPEAITSQTESASTAAPGGDDPAPVEPAGQRQSSEASTGTADSRIAASAAPPLVKSQDGMHDSSAAAQAAPQPVNTMADLKDREISETAAVNPALVAAKRRANLVGSPWRVAAVIALGVGLGLMGYALWPEETSGPELAATEPGPDFTGSQGVASQGVAPQSTAPKETGDEAADTEVVQAAGDPSAPSAPADDNSALGAPPSLPEPSFDVIRIEPNGQSIIAGRAEPFSEWILLNNGQPIGSVQADLNGEWVILPDASLIPGANDFSLVPKTERGKVAIPAADEAPAEAIKSDLPENGPLAPRSEDSSSLLEEKLAALGQDAVLPLPRLKPSAGDATTASLGVRISPDGGYQIQIASVRQSAAAERERLRLVDIYPGLLGALGLQVQEASIDGAGVFYRLRSGPIADLADARELCRQLELRGQSCLVVVRAGDDAVLNPSGKNAIEPLAAPGLSSTQQAENPD